MIPPPPRSTLFPYTTLFRSHPAPGPLRTTPDYRGAPSTAAFTAAINAMPGFRRSEEHTSELQSHVNLVCRLLLEKKKKKKQKNKLTIRKTASPHRHSRVTSA